MRHLKQFNDRPGRVAVTIDDGPNPDTTEAMLEVLAAHRVSASFFACGINAERHPDLCARIVAAGHGLYSHAFDHRALDALSAAEVFDQLERTEAALRPHRPTPSPYFLRLPFDAGAESPNLAGAVDAWHGDVVAVHWSLCAKEWEFIDRCPTPSRIVRTCGRRVDALPAEDWDQAVILLHDWPAVPSGGGAKRPLTPAFCAALLDTYLLRLKRKGLRAGPLT